MLETLTGVGLATAAGLNAYIPLVLVGLLARFTDLIELPGPWHWLENGWVLAFLIVLLAVETVADKIPIVDHANDVVQTFVRPTAGGLAFGAASTSQTVTVSDPANFFSSHQWAPIAAGVLISLLVHGMKASARPVINLSTAGLGAPVVSTIEDIASFGFALIAIVLPFLIIIMVAALFAFFIWAIRARRRRREAKAAAARAAQAGYYSGYPPY